MVTKISRVQYPTFQINWHDGLRGFFHHLFHPGNLASLSSQLRAMLNVVNEYFVLARRLFPTYSQDFIKQRMKSWLRTNPEFRRLHGDQQRLFAYSLMVAMQLADKV
jgi:hypothetical protein